MTKEEISEYPRALVEVWEMKEAVAKEMAGKTWEEKKELYHQGMIEAAILMNAELVKLPNGNYKFVKKES